MLGVFVTSCAGSDSPPPPADGFGFPPVEQAPSPPGEDVGHLAGTAYVGMWQAMATAGETSDWQSPELTRFATGNALTTITRSLYTDHLNGVVTRGVPRTVPQVASVHPARAPETVTVLDCGDATATSKVRAATNEPINDTPSGRRSIVAEIKIQPGGKWKVHQFAVQGVGTC